MPARGDTLACTMAVAIIWGSSFPTAEPVHDLLLRSDSVPCRHGSHAHTRPPTSVSGLERLAGSYVLTLTWPDRPTSDSSRVRPGSLVLWVTDASHRSFLCPSSSCKAGPNITYPLAGATDVKFPTGFEQFLPVSPNSRDPDAPGVQVSSKAKIVVGNPLGPKRGPSTDSGIYMSILDADSSWFSGTWVLGAAIRPLPGGSFCAQRVASGP
jgi:hypothetical protein